MDSTIRLPLTAVLLAAVLNAGCTTTARMDYQSLNHFRVNCAKKYEQLEFLQSQWPSSNDRLVNGMMISSTSGFIASVADGTYQERRYLNDGYYTSVLRLLIDQVKQCPDY